MKSLRRMWKGRYDAYLLYKPEKWLSSDMRYLTGFSGSTAVFLQTRRRNYLIVDFRYKQQSRREVGEGLTVLDVPPGESTLDFLSSKMKSLAVSRVAVEGNVPASFLKALRGRLRGSGIRLGIVSGLVGNLRIRKERGEIESIRRAQRLTDALFEWVLNNLRPGKMTEKELAFEMEVWARRNGADGMSFPPIVAGNERSAMPHAKPTDEPLPEKGVLLLDFGIRLDGYVSDMTRTLWIGKGITDGFKRAYGVVLEAQKRAIEKLSFRGRRRAKDVDAAARDFIEGTEFKGKFGHGLGHGVGMDVHEGPVLSPKSRDVLRGGEVVTVEPGVYLEGEFGVRIEDMVVAGSGEVLTSSPKDLVVL